MRPTLAVVIVSWNVRDMLRECLHSLRDAQVDVQAEIEIFVVDSASVDGSAGMVRDEFPEVHLDAYSDNIGYVRGNNLILNRFHAGTMPDYVWLLNPDTRVNAHAIDSLLDFMQTHPDTGLVGPKLLNTDGSLQECAFRFPGILQPLFDFGYMPQRLYYTHLNGRYSQAQYAGSQPFRIDHPLGAAMLARGDAVRQVGVLDERFFMYCEEVDWAWRMKNAGWQVWLVPEAKVIHHGGASSKQAKAATIGHLWESRAKLYRKHRSAWTFSVVSRLVRTYFTRQSPRDPEWERAYKNIIKAWLPDSEQENRQ